MAILQPLPLDLDPVSARPFLANLGFIANSDLPDRPGPAYLLVAIRPEPTLRHYDPEGIEYWLTEGGRGVRHRLTRQTRLPVHIAISWGRIRIIDRLKVTNEFITFGGRLAADLVGDCVVAVFDSRAPILRRGGHSQVWDHGAECASAFFGRLLLTVDVVPGFEARLSAATPLARYAAFVAETIQRYRPSPALREDHPDLWAVLQAEDRRLQAENPADCAAARDLLAAFAGRNRSERRP